MTVTLPPLVAKALADSGYDLVSSAEHQWIAARVSGSSEMVLVRAVESGTILALPEPEMAQRIGLAKVDCAPPLNMASIGLAREPAQLFEALRLLHSLQTHPATLLAARVESRLAELPETERTREVRQRIGQDVFREALMDLWRARCAVTGLQLPPALLRASHAKPWAKASDLERLDPFNGLLLSIHLDAMFDAGLIAFADDGQIMTSASLDADTRSLFGIENGMRLRTFAPGHLFYLAWHRLFVYRG